jgi:hypothetical protein
MEGTQIPYLPEVALSTGARTRISAVVLAGFGVVALVRALTLPRSLWELDEMLFALGIERFDPIAHHPHPPGYPLLIGLGKLFNLIFHDPFTSLVVLSLLSSLISYPALVVAFRRIAGEGSERLAVAGSLLFLLSPVMLVQGPLPMSDPPSLMFIALALAAGAMIAEGAEGGGTGAAIALGAAASAAIGCRPSNALAVIPMLAVALWQAPSWRRRLEGAGAFALVSLGWFVPLVQATGGMHGFLDYQLEQAAYVAAHDASASREGRDIVAVAARFVANPWGPRWLALPVLGLAIAGLVRLVRRRRKLALPLAALSGTHLAFCLAAMDPGDGARYALPSVLGMAFAAVVGCQALADRVRKPALVWMAPALILAISLAYTTPVLAARAAGPSPPVQAIEWTLQNVPSAAIILVSEEMAPHATYFLRSHSLSRIEDGLRRAARRPRAPVYLLAEGESGWPGAKMFEWPASDAYRRVTRNHYRVISVSPIPEHWRFQILGGVHGWEPDALHARWRWLDAAAAIRLFPRGGRSASVKLGLDRSSPLASTSVAIVVNGAPAANVVIPRGTSQNVELPLPFARLAPVEIAFQSNQSFISNDGARAGRSLAVQFFGVWITPENVKEVSHEPETTFRRARDPDVQRGRKYRARARLRDGGAGPVQRRLRDHRRGRRVDGSLRRDRRAGGRRRSADPDSPP